MTQGDLAEFMVRELVEGKWVRAAPYKPVIGDNPPTRPRARPTLDGDAWLASLARCG